MSSRNGNASKSRWHDDANNDDGGERGALVVLSGAGVR